MVYGYYYYQLFKFNAGLVYVQWCVIAFQLVVVCKDKQEYSALVLVSCYRTIVLLLLVRSVKCIIGVNWYHSLIKIIMNYYIMNTQQLEVCWAAFIMLFAHFICTSNSDCLFIVLWFSSFVCALLFLQRHYLCLVSSFLLLFLVVCSPRTCISKSLLTLSDDGYPPPAVPVLLASMLVAGGVGITTPQFNSMFPAVAPAIMKIFGSTVEGTATQTKTSTKGEGLRVG